MEKWESIISNDPLDDFNLIIEVEFDGMHCATIKKGPKGLEMTWYPHNDILSVPLDWLHNLLEKARSEL